jgi:hypothetical protein
MKNVRCQVFGSGALRERTQILQRIRAVLAIFAQHGIVKDDTQCMPLSLMQPPDPVTQIRMVEAASETHGPMVGGEHHGIPLAQENQVCPAGLLQIAFGQRQFAAFECVTDPKLPISYKIL